MNCSICNKKVKDPYGHNAQPINNGLCCSECNFEIVIPVRFKSLDIFETMVKKEKK